MQLALASTAHHQSMHPLPHSQIPGNHLPLPMPYNYALFHGTLLLEVKFLNFKMLSGKCIKELLHKNTTKIMLLCNFCVVTVKIRWQFLNDVTQIWKFLATSSNALYLMAWCHKILYPQPHPCMTSLVNVQWVKEVLITWGLTPIFSNAGGTTIGGGTMISASDLPNPLDQMLIQRTDRKSGPCLGRARRIVRLL